MSQHVTNCAKTCLILNNGVQRKTRNSPSGNHFFPYDQEVIKPDYGSKGQRVESSQARHNRVAFTPINCARIVRTLTKNNSVQIDQAKTIKIGKCKINKLDAVQQGRTGKWRSCSEALLKSGKITGSFTLPLL